MLLFCLKRYCLDIDRMGFEIELNIVFIVFLNVFSLLVLFFYYSLKLKCGILYLFLYFLYFKIIC